MARRDAAGVRLSPAMAPTDRLATHDVNQNHSAADKAPEQPWSNAMLAEIFILRLEAAARVAKFEAATSSRFVPITLL
jgi:hypothetical protein